MPEGAARDKAGAAPVSLQRRHAIG
jgi:hypothetical protein